MARLLRILLVSVLLACFVSAENTVVVGYVPDYRFNHVDWAGIAKHTTHINVFSVEPSAAGELMSSDPLLDLLKPGSPLDKALALAGSRAPKVLVTLGGAGRSQHFPKALGSKKLRKKLAQQVRRLFDENEMISGIDIDWETPQSQEHYRDLGKFVKEVRETFDGRPLIISMTYHPRSGAVAAMASIRGKTSGTSFVELFDMVHAMGYGRFDADRKHSSPTLDRAIVDEWVAAGLPLGRLTLGMPFFGVDRKTGTPATYGQIVDEEPSLVNRPGVDETSNGRYFVNARSLTHKVRFAQREGLAGVMIWEVGQDKRVDSGISLLQHVWNTAQTGAVLDKKWGEAFWTQFYAFGENEVMGMIASIIGAVLLYNVLFTVHPREHFQPPPRVKKPKAASLLADLPVRAEAEAAEGDAKE